MFHNAGEKIKITAIVLMCLGAIGSVGGAVACWRVGLTIPGFVVLAGGFFASWVGSLVLYGFGEVVDFWSDK